MKRLILLLISICCLIASAQEAPKNSLSTSLIRLERNSQTMHKEYKLKFMTGIDYQRHVNKWSFGIKYEHGFNKIKEYPINCYDCFSGTGYIREDNFYLTASYSLFSLFNSKLKFNTGLAAYYSNLNFSGYYQGGISGSGIRENSTYNTIGLAPSISITYYATERLFISLNSNLRTGWSRESDLNSMQERKTYEFVATAPELKIGVSF